MSGSVANVAWEVSIAELSNIEDGSGEAEPHLSCFAGVLSCGDACSRVEEAAGMHCRFAAGSSAAINMVFLLVLVVASRDSDTIGLASVIFEVWFEAGDWAFASRGPNTRLLAGEASILI